MAILATGSGKNMIYTVFALAKEEISSLKTCVIVISPLKSIIDDQISEMMSLNCTATSLQSMVELDEISRVQSHVLPRAQLSQGKLPKYLIDGRAF